ncbi:MAG: serine hydrolase domain-containing protein [Caldilineaceae bacterium]
MLYCCKPVCRLYYCVGLLLILFTLFPAAPLLAAPPTQAKLPLQAAEVEAFWDGLLAAQMDAFHLPGATVAVVQDGKLLFAKGYGYADIATHKPVVADESVFRPGSISKLFIWTAVMQLVEQGKLDLDADVNRYLKTFQIPNTLQLPSGSVPAAPITLAHLLTHTPGFEERGDGLFRRSVEDLLPLEEYLSQYMPARVRPPGSLTAYSNYGTALAGYIISQVSGMPYEQYIEERIFQPLQMQHSSFRQPLPDALMGNLATGYVYSGGQQEARPFELVQASPAGALSTTATDIANFMIAHLQNGRFGDTSILSEATAQLMHEQSFTNDPRVNGFAHGFIEATFNGQQLIWHAGDTLYFHSILMLLPVHNIGFFVSYNGVNGASAYLNTVRALFDHYFPAAVTALPTPAADAATHAQQVAGSYLAARSNQTSPEKIANLFQLMTVQPTANGELIVSVGTPAQESGRYVEVAPWIYASVDTPPSVFGNLVFRADEEGQITQLFQSNNPTTAYLRVPWYAASGFGLSLVSLCFVLFLITIIGGLVALWIRWRYHEQRTWLAQVAAWSAGLLSLISVIFVVGFAGAVSNLEAIMFGIPGWLKALMAAPWLVALLTVVMLVLTPIVWRQRFWSLPRRLHYTVLLLAGGAFVWWLYFWNLLILPV